MKNAFPTELFFRAIVPGRIFRLRKKGRLANDEKSDDLCSSPIRYAVMIVLASVALSADGYIDDSSPERLVLSHEADWQEVRRLRAECDAVLIGAETVRKDNPSLRTKDEPLKAMRRARHLPDDPVKVTVSRSGNLDPRSRFFTQGTSEKIVIVGRDAPQTNIDRLRTVATVVRTKNDDASADEIVGILEQRGIRKMMIEGGCRILTMFLTEDRVDLLRIAVAPFFVGDPQAPRFVEGGRFPFGPARRMDVVRVERVGDMTVTEYALNARSADRAYLQRTIDLARMCPPSETAYSVGALIVTPDKRLFTGYSRETAPDNHAEEEAILKAIRAGVSLKGSVIYSSMEPCSSRKSKPLPCCELIIRHQMVRVVFATYEPDRFVNCCGAQRLDEAGIEVTVLNELASEAIRANGHILDEGRSRP